MASFLIKLDHIIEYYNSKNKIEENIISKYDICLDLYKKNLISKNIFEKIKKSEKKNNDENQCVAILKNNKKIRCKNKIDDISLNSINNDKLNLSTEINCKHQKEIPKFLLNHNLCKYHLKNNNYPHFIYNKTNESNITCIKNFKFKTFITEKSKNLSEFQNIDTYNSEQFKFIKPSSKLSNKTSKFIDSKLKIPKKKYSKNSNKLNFDSDSSNSSNYDE